MMYEDQETGERRLPEGVNLQTVRVIDQRRDPDGFAVGRAAAAEQPEIPGITPAQRDAEALAEERENAIAEPYNVDDDLVKDGDARARAYMVIHDHYRAAYNAVAHREMVEFWARMLEDLFEAILGRRPSAPVLKDDIRRLIHEATLERARLLAQIERSTETLAVQASSVESQQRLIAEMSQSAARGKRAHDVFMLLAVRLGINPVPQDPTEFLDAVMAAFAAAQPKENRT